MNVSSSVAKEIAIKLVLDYLSNIVSIESN